VTLRRARRAPPREGPLFAAAVALLFVALLGLTTGATQVTSGPVESGQGTDVGEQGLAYWVWEATQLHAVPTPAPAVLSANAAAPTPLPFGGRSYAIGAVTAGAEGIRFEFQEQTTAPGLTELELRFVVGLSTSAVTIKVYVETRAVPPIRVLTYYLYWNPGPFPPTQLTIATEQATALACTAIGTCP
jgi:hypothetical protein